MKMRLGVWPWRLLGGHGRSGLFWQRDRSGVFLMCVPPCGTWRVCLRRRSDEGMAHVASRFPGFERRYILSVAWPAGRLWQRTW